MIVDKKYKIEKAVSTDGTRYVLNHVYLDVEKKRAVATTGRILAVVPCDIADDDVTGMIPVDAIKAARKVKGLNIVVGANGNCETLNGQTFKRPDGTFPKYEGVIPKHASGGIKISLNAKFLYQLAQATGDDEVILDIQDAGSAVIVTPYHREPNAFGVIMPIRIKK